MSTQASPPTPSVERTDILRTLAMFVPTGQVTELRALDVSTKAYPRPHTVSGYFDDLDRLAHEAEKVARYAKGVYVVPNVVDPALVARAANRVRAVDREPLTSDANILRRRWVLLDADPVRPAGISSTDLEHAAGLARIDEIRTALREEGWPEGAKADSGNGGHGLYQIDLPNDDASRTLLEHVLQALAFRFDDAVVTLDQKVFNAGRLWKLYGTIARKGDHTADRPHRVSRLLEVPDVWVDVTVEQLQAMARQRPASPQAPRASPRPGTGAPFDLDQWIATHGLDLSGPHPWQGGRKWVFRVCPWHDEHRNWSAYLVQQAGGAIAAGCHHNSCAGKDWHALRDLVEPDWRTRGQSHRAARPTAGSAASNGTMAGARQAPDTPLEDTPLSDQFNAEALVRDYGAELRYCHPWEAWLVWDSTHWQPDQTGEVMRRAKETVRSFAHDLAHLSGDEFKAMLGHFKTSLSAFRLEGMVRLARSEPGIPVLPEALDRDPWALNVRNGTLDLRSGEMRPHRQEDLLTRCLPVVYDARATCPRWLQFLHDIMAGKTAMIDYLQRAVGYSLTGSVEEQVFFFCYGTGRNGKTTFLNVLLALAGAYGMQAMPELLMVRRHETHPTEKADLYQKRLVTAVELEANGRLSESLVKLLTGGERIRARRMRENFWEFEPTHTFWVSSNHKPVIRGTDDAIWRRPRLIPFTVTIAEKKTDSP